MKLTPELIAKELEDASDSLEHHAQATYMEYLANMASYIRVDTRYASCTIKLDGLTIHSDTRSVSSETMKATFSTHAENALVHYFVHFLANTYNKLSIS